jgi:hypothetical protein
MTFLTARGGFVIQKQPATLVYSGAVRAFQLAIPWSLRAFVQRPLTPAEELLEVLARDGEPVVSDWARSVRGRVRHTCDLAAELDRLESEGGLVAHVLAASVRDAWRQFGGQPLPTRAVPSAQQPLPLA